MQIYKLMVLAIVFLGSLVKAQSTEGSRISFHEQIVGEVRMFISSDKQCVITPEKNSSRENGTLSVRLLGDNLYIGKDLIVVELISIIEKDGSVTLLDQRFAVHKNSGIKEKNIQLGDFNEFSKKYRDAARRDLPDDVRGLFHDFFDID